MFKYRLKYNCMYGQEGDIVEMPNETNDRSFEPYTDEEIRDKKEKIVIKPKDGKSK